MTPSPQPVQLQSYAMSSPQSVLKAKRKETFISVKEGLRSGTALDPLWYNKSQLAGWFAIVVWSFGQIRRDYTSPYILLMKLDSNRVPAMSYYGQNEGLFYSICNAFGSNFYWEHYQAPCNSYSTWWMRQLRQQGTICMRIQQLEWTLKNKGCPKRCGFRSQLVIFIELFIKASLAKRTMPSRNETLRNTESLVHIFLWTWDTRFLLASLALSSYICLQKCQYPTGYSDIPAARNCWNLFKQW